MSPTDSKIFFFLISAFAGFFSKIIWDWLSSGRMEKKSAYVSQKECEQHRERCCMPQLKTKVGVIGNRLDTAETQLERGGKDFRLLRSDISEIKETIARIDTCMKSIINNQHKQQDRI